MQEQTLLVVQGAPRKQHRIGSVLLQAFPHSTVITCPSAHAALELMQRRDIDIAIVDLDLPDGSGADVVREITRTSPQTTCVTIMERSSRPVAPTASTDDLAALSAREKQVLGLVAKGLQIADVAKALEISTNTVCSHVKSIYRKRKVCSRAEAALEAQRLGLA